MMNESDYKPNPFHTVWEAMDLADYVIKITDNINKFPVFDQKEIKNADGTVTKVMMERQDTLVNWIREQTKEIFVLIFTANNIDLRKEPWRKDERLEKQLRAIALCDEHLAAVQLCGKHFHLAKRRIKYWGERTIKVKGLIAKWHTSDKTRYQNI